MKSLRYLIPAAVFVALVGFLLIGLQHDPRKLPSPLIDKPAPAFSLPILTDAKAEPMSLKSLAGKPVLMNVFASWCTPCLQEHPMLMELAKQKRVAIVGINYKDSPDAAKNWLRRHGNPYSQIGADTDGRVAIDFGVYGVPESYLIDAKGIIRYKKVGPFTEQEIQTELLPALEAVEKEARG